MPVEIMLRIFLFATRIDDCKKCRMAPLRLRGEECSCKLPSQFLVSSACRRWRDVALQYPLLWTTLRLSCRMPMDFVRLLVARATSQNLINSEGSAPPCLDFHLTLRDSDLESSDNLETLLYVIVAEHKRWCGLRIVAPSTSGPFTTIRGGLAKLAVPRLESLEIICLDGYRSSKDDWHVPPVLDIFRGGAPSLQRIELRGCSLSSSNLDNAFSMREFSVIAGPCMTKDVRLLAAVAAGLTHLAFVDQCTADWHEGENTRSPLRFSSLRGLRISGARCFVQFLQLLEAPELERLQVEDLHVDGVDVLGDCFEGTTALTPVVARLPRLRWLGLEIHAISTNNPSLVLKRLRHFVAAFPCIRHLVFSGPDVVAFVRELRAGHSTPAGALLPALECLILSGAHGHDLLCEVAALAEARKAVGCPLRNIQLSITVTTSRQDLPQKFCKILQMQFRGTRTTGVIYPDGETWMHSTHEREEWRTTEYLHR
ncbi:uncharacterized protein B0H18DRAFT_971320 [Fomitopsis serialis]|uniref:uncharacterized protein n=1 Tax=Fomitopsis serialis TaxID=139415 RepID=UPI0020080A18|nr:uncharacterized protein B0H18DRAFT_971320 [Neoantrodia serialis]KAH9937583.1 hypothetical protein B0H18DRAFT_971320 [Neoantrodia serialis]